MNSNMLLGFLILITAKCVSAELEDIEPPEISTFDDLVVKHIYTCSQHSTCHQFFESDSSPCCGSCTCDDHCVEHGSCCLNEYHSLAHARQAVQNTRYKCVLSQYLSSSETQYGGSEAFWMVTKCDPDFSNIAITQLCQRPRNELETLVPVTDLISNINFRNKFCAQCNNLDINISVISWKLQIHSYDHISFPTDNLLEHIRQTKGNIFFVPPDYVSVQNCDPVPSYEISSCNETGEWPLYDDIIAKGCDSFIDPFNYTYKNYFCYLCNNGQDVSTQDWICPEKDINPEGIPVVFSAIIDQEIVTAKPTADSLICESSQFKDEILMVCRDVLCYTGRVLENGVCSNNKKNKKKICSSIDIQLVPRRDVEVYDRFYTALDLKHVLQYVNPHLNGTIEDFILFYKNNHLYHLEYMVVRIVSEFSNRNSMFDFLDLMVSTPHIAVQVMFERDMLFAVKLAMLNMDVFKHTAKLYVPNISDMSVDELVSRVNVSGTCAYNETLQVNKLHNCPFVKLGMNEISITLENDFLFVQDFASKKLFKTLSKWEYKIHEDNIYMCLEDYLDIYYMMAERKATKSSTVISSPAPLQTVLVMIGIAGGIL